MKQLLHIALVLSVSAQQSLCTQDNPEQHVMKRNPRNGMSRPANHEYERQRPHGEPTYTAAIDSCCVLCLLCLAFCYDACWCCKRRRSS